MRKEDQTEGNKYKRTGHEGEIYLFFQESVSEIWIDRGGEEENEIGCETAAGCEIEDAEREETRAQRFPQTQDPVVAASYKYVINSGAREEREGREEARTHVIHPMRTTRGDRGHYFANQRRIQIRCALVVAGGHPQCGGRQTPRTTSDPANNGGN